MLAAIKQGESDPQVLAELAKGRLREKLPALRLALDGRVQAHHQLLIGELLDHLDYLDRAIHRVEVNSAALVAQEEKAVELLLTLPATGPVTAAAIIAEIGTDMSRFPQCRSSRFVGRRLSWQQAQCRQTAQWGEHQRQQTAEARSCARIAATIARSPGTYLHARSQRIARRRGKPRAMMAVAHSLLVSIYSMLRDQVSYQEMGPDYFDQLHAQHLERHYVRRLEALGFQLTLTSAS